MSDIVKRLRADGALLAIDAADEIERLQANYGILKIDYDAQRIELDNALHDLAVICKAKDEKIEELRKDRTVLVEHSIKLEREVERLQAIAKCYDNLTQDAERRVAR